MNNSRLIDLDLVDKVMELIPPNTWSYVLERLVTHFVDGMTSDVLQQLTGTFDDFDAAEKILFDYYTDPDLESTELIIDAFKILGPENTLYYLDSLQLDKYSDFLNNKTTHGISESTAS